MHLEEEATNLANVLWLSNLAATRNSDIMKKFKILLRNTVICLMFLGFLQLAQTSVQVMKAQIFGGRRTDVQYVRSDDKKNLDTPPQSNTAVLYTLQ